MAVRQLRADPVAGVSAEHGEGPAWDEGAGHLLWVDMIAGGLHRTRSDGADKVTWYEQPVCVAVPRVAAGGLALALGDGLWLEDADGARRRLYAIPQPDGAGAIRMNDGKCDPQGRLWAGSMAYDARDGAGTLYRLDQDLTVHEIVPGVTISNGLAWTPDGTTMYYIDTPTNRVDSFDADPATGAVRNRRPAIVIPKAAGGPDGMTIDDEGCLWVALWGGSAVHRYAPDGRLDTVVSLPCKQVTSCAFGGAGLDELWITSSRLGLPAEDVAAQPLAGNLFVLRPGVTGPAAVAFTG